VSQNDYSELGWVEEQIEEIAEEDEEEFGTEPRVAAGQGVYCNPAVEVFSSNDDEGGLSEEDDIEEHIMKARESSVVEQEREPHRAQKSPSEEKIRFA